MTTINFTTNWRNITIPNNRHPSNHTQSGCLTQIGDRYLVVLGGENDHGQGYRSMVMYDILDDAWIENLPQMHISRIIFTCQAVNDHLYAIGMYI